METSKSDHDMMKEISAYVAASNRSKAAASKRKLKDPNSPYLIDQVKLLPAECFPTNDTAQTQERIRKRIEKAAQRKKKPSDPDELLNFYASQQRRDLGVPKEVVEVKALTLPFGDTMMKIDQYIALDKSLRSSEMSFDKYNEAFKSSKPVPRAIPRIPQASLTSSSAGAKLSRTFTDPSTNNTASTVTAALTQKRGDSRFHRKYPRLCSTFHFTDSDIDAVDSTLRSDYWMARFMEDCFDEAYIVCNTAMSKEEKWRLRNGLDLGSMDSFPKVVERVLGVRYSMMNIRTQICLEFLCALDRLLALSEASRISELPSTAQAVQETGEHVYDGERAQFFSKFLSEEYDLDFLAMFLYVRSVIQKVFNFRLRDLNQARIWLGEGVGEDEGVDWSEKGIGMAEFTYYRIQQKDNTSGINTQQQQPGANKRKLAWSAETMTLTAKLDAQIGARNKNKSTAARNRNHDSMYSINNDPGPVAAGELSAASAASGSPLKRVRMTASEKMRARNSSKSSESLPAADPALNSSAVFDESNAAAALGSTSTTNNNTNNTNSALPMVDTLHPAPEGKKVVPVSLPNSWHFLHDLTMPEAPIVGFDMGLISLLFMHILPKTSQAVRTYLTDRAVELTKEALMDTASAISNLAEDSAVLDSTGRVSVSTAKESYAARKTIRIIPLYILLKTLCVEWRKLSLEAKVAFIESGAGSESLKSLNVIYADNNELRRQLDEDINEVQKALGASVGRVLALEKTFRRLERRRLQNTATGQDLESIEESRILLNNEKATLSEREATLSVLLQRRKGLEQKIEVLWRKATLNVIPVDTSTRRRRKFNALLKNSISEADKRKPTAQEQIAARHSDWKSVIGNWLVKVIVTNQEEDVTVKKAAWQKLQRERQEKETMRAAAEERALAEAEAAEEMKNLSRSGKRPLTSGANIMVPGPAQEFFILEVLAKVMVRNILRDGVRRVALQEYMRRKEHELLLIYGSSDYKKRDRERLLREKEEREQRQRYLQRVQAARIMSGGIIDHTFGLAKSSAEALLFDPWSLLDLHPSTWLSPTVLHVVEGLFQQAKAKYERKCLKLLFHFIKRGWGVHKLLSKLRHRTCKIVLKSIWRDMMAARHLNVCACSIQKVIKAFIFRQRFCKHLRRLHCNHVLALKGEQSALRSKRAKCFQFWRKSCSLSYRYKTTIAALKDRRFILTFYIWRDQFKKHKFARIVLSKEQLRACISLQGAVRYFVARRRFKVRWASKKIGRLGQRFIARRCVQTEREYARRLGDYSANIGMIQQNHELRRHFAAWKVCKNVISCVAHLDQAVRCDKLRRRFKKWLNLSQYRTRRLAVRAIQIQSTVRMWLTHKYILHYYPWRRGLVAFQSIHRKILCVRQFVYDIYFYRKAKCIQRVFRGYRCRIHMNDARVIDIHYAASHNNYDRLLYYVEKFPELITLPDADGNNALHSAAKNACKRTLKLLMRHQFLNPNVKNAEGYTALHLTIMSVSPARDDCYLYMMERGFSDEVQGPDNKTTLLIAAEHGRTIITRHLLEEEDHNPNIADANGTTALQTACWQGNLAMVRDLIDNEADVNMPGYNGTFPLHDCVYGGNAEIAQLLLAHGAYVNVYEPYSYQTPLMYACSAGMTDIARQYLIQGAEVNAKDTKGQTAAHLGVMSNNANIYNALREADADFECQDNEGNCPLHLAAENGNSEFAVAMLHGGVYPSWQNNHGDQPAHIAARYNQLEMLQQICRYDEHIGRVNYEHQTPLGVAKFNLSKECVEFLTHHYRMVNVKDGRNQLGEVWWDKAIDDAVGDWEVSVNSAGERFYMNRKTAEVSLIPPSLSAGQVLKSAQTAELPLHRTVTIVKEENTLTKHAYYLEYAEKEKDVAEIAKDFVNATIIVKFARRKLAYLELDRLKKHKKRTAALTRFLKRHLPGFMLWRAVVYNRCAVKIQAAYRGYKLRKRYFAWPKGEYYRRRLAKAHWRLRYKLWAKWKFYIRRQEFKLMRLNKNQPQTLHDWQIIIDEARRPVRKVGIYEDYLYPNTHNIHFYRHSLTGACTFNKPKKMKIIDELDTIERHQIKKYGATLKQIHLATKLQSIWRGYLVRTYSKYVARAMQISVHAESNYLSNPDVDSNLYNYALHCFVGLQDLGRARRAFVEALRRMQWRGPDIPFVLYSYSIFAIVARDEDYADVMLLLTRARQAEEEIDAIKRKKLGATDESNEKSKDGTFRYGKSYDLANTGFFRHLAVQSHNSFGWQAFAVCRFLVYRDFPGSFDAFMDAFRFAPEDKNLMDSFNMMMIHFHGKNKAHRDEVVKARQQKLAQMDADVQEGLRQRRVYAQLRSDSARSIQNWYKKCKENRIYWAFMEGVRSIIRRRRRVVSTYSRASGPPSSAASPSRRHTDSRGGSRSRGDSRERGSTPVGYGVGAGAGVSSSRRSERRSLSPSSPPSAPPSAPASLALLV